MDVGRYGNQCHRVCGSQRTTERSWFSPTMWVLGLKLRWSAWQHRLLPAEPVLMLFDSHFLHS